MTTNNPSYNYTQKVPTDGIIFNFPSQSDIIPSLLSNIKTTQNDEKKKYFTA